MCLVVMPKTTHHAEHHTLDNGTGERPRSELFRVPSSTCYQGSTRVLPGCYQTSQTCIRNHTQKQTTKQTNAPARHSSILDLHGLLFWRERGTAPNQPAPSRRRPRSGRDWSSFLITPALGQGGGAGRRGAWSRSSWQRCLAALRQHYEPDVPQPARLETLSLMQLHGMGAKL